MDNELEIIIRKYFREEKILQYHPWDSVYERQYLRWEYHKHKRNEILIFIGSDEGEVTVKVFTEALKLETFIRVTIYD